MKKHLKPHLLRYIRMKQLSFKTELGKFFLQVYHHLHLSALEKGPLAWCLIVLLVLLFLLPLPVLPPSIQGTYEALSLVPIVLAAMLRASKGALVSCGLLTCGSTLINIQIYGFSWPRGVWQSWVLGNLVLLFVALTLGYVRTLGNHLALAHSQLTIALNEIQKQALTDALTGLPNHRAIVQCLEKEYERSRRNQRPLSVIFFDSDHFKRINDTYGHPIGDVVLQELGRCGSKALRSSDIIGRFGGEEFVVLLPETDTIEANRIAERLRVAVANQPLARAQQERGIKVTISIGTATYPEDGESSADLLRIADQAMYLAKRLGRNQVCTAASTKQVQDATLPA